jgi:hypothetical protein
MSQFFLAQIAQTVKPRVERPKFDFGQEQALLNKPQRPDRPWGLLSLLSNGYRSSYSWAKAIVA